MKQNRPIPQWIRLRTNNKIRCGKEADNLTSERRLVALEGRTSDLFNFLSSCFFFVLFDSSAQVQRQAKALEEHEAEAVKETLWRRRLP